LKIIYNNVKYFLKNYLKKYRMVNAAQDNLWSELTNQGHLDLVLDKSLSIKSIMDTWTLKKGIYQFYLNDHIAKSKIYYCLRLSCC